MGCGRGFAFILGSLCGVYVAQHYRVPRIGDWAHSSCVRARELEQAYRRPDDYNHGAQMKAKYHRPENFYGNEAGEEQKNEAVHPSLSQPINTLDPREKQNVVQPRWVRPRDPINKPYYNNRPENFNPNEHGQE